MDLDNSIDVDSHPTTAADPPIAGPDAMTRDADPTVTLPQRDRSEAEASLLFGLLALANGLIESEVLTRALGAWTGSTGRPLREILVEQGHLDESDASMVAALASKHLEQHHGVAWESLIALGDAIRFRLDPSEVADSELRGLLASVVDIPRTSAGSRGTDGLSSRYEILRHHARGGLGVISVANDRELHREVAVKEIRDDCADHPDYRARFLREAEVTGRLEHPGIVPVYGIGYHDDGRPYYIMRFIRGETLKVAISRLHKVGVDREETGTDKRPDLHSLIGRFIDACHAVAYAHHRKILHRDLKPINIMLGPFGETLVVDWGLAKTFGGSRSGEVLIPVEEGTLRPESGSELTPTRMGSQVGTVGFMSPEQSAGLLSQLGPTSDVYSLGATLYCLATGRAPFEGADKDEFLRRVLIGDFSRPSKVNPSVPRALEAICLKAMALRPVDRYQTVGELIDDLEHWRAGSPVLAYPEPPIDRLARWAKRHKTTLAGAAVLLVCATIGLAAFAAKEREDNVKLTAARGLAEQQKSVAEIARADSEANRRSALNSLKSTLKVVEGADLAFLARSEDLRLRMANDLMKSYRDLLKRDPNEKQVQFDLAQSCKLAANIGRSTGMLKQPAILYAEAIRLLESLGEFAPGKEDVGLELTMLHDDSAEYFRMVGKPDEARAEHLKGLQTLSRAGSVERPDDVRRRAEARLQVDLSADLLELGRFDESKEASRRAVDLIGPLASATVERGDRLTLVLASLLRANACRLEGEFDRAKAELADAERRARAVMASSYDPDTRLALVAVRNSQGYLLIQANPEGSRGPALAAFDEACSHLVTLYRNMPRMVEFRRSLASALIGRGTCYLEQKRLPEARADFTAASQLLEQLDAAIPGHFEQLGLRGAALAGLGLVSRSEGDSEAARTMLLKAVDSYTAALKINPDAPDLKRFKADAQRGLARLGEGAAPPALRP